MADLDQISAGIGGLQADMKRAMEWFDKHEEADQRRFEELRQRIEAIATRNEDRVTALELHKAEVTGSWKTLVSVSGVVAFVVSLASGYIAKFFSYG